MLYDKKKKYSIHGCLIFIKYTGVPVYFAPWTGCPPLSPTLEIGFCILAGSICILWNISVYSCKSNYRIYPKYSDTLNVRTRYFFLKRHLFYVPYISGHVPNRVFLLSIHVRTQKTDPLFLIKLSFFTTEIFWQFPLFTCVSGSETDNPLCPVCVQ